MAAGGLATSSKPSVSYIKEQDGPVCPGLNLAQCSRPVAKSHSAVDSVCQRSSGEYEALVEEDTPSVLRQPHDPSSWVERIAEPLGDGIKAGAFAMQQAIGEQGATGLSMPIGFLVGAGLDWIADQMGMGLDILEQAVQPSPPQWAPVDLYGSMFLSPTAVPYAHTAPKHESERQELPDTPSTCTPPDSPQSSNRTCDVKGMMDSSEEHDR